MTLKFLTEPLEGINVSELSFMSGNWKAIGGTGENKHIYQEFWSQVEVNSIMGIFQLIREGKVVVYELLQIISENNLICMRLRHFDQNLIPWEEKDTALELFLVELEDKKAVFLRTDSTELEWFAYEYENNTLTFYNYTSDGNHLMDMSFRKVSL